MDLLKSLTPHFVMLSPMQTKNVFNVETQSGQQALLAAILFEDSRFLILNKPSGLAVHGGSGKSLGVIESLRAIRPDAPYLELAHRLDRDTSGCLVIAKRRSALRAFQKQQENRQVNKYYLALIQGKWQGGHRRVDAPLLKTKLQTGEWVVSVDAQGKRAVSAFSAVEKFEQATLARVKLMTGRTHQIRVHALHIGQTIAGDSKYGDELFNQDMFALGLKRLYLHAESICFTLPQVEKTYAVQAPLDEDLKQLLGQLQPCV